MSKSELKSSTAVKANSSLFADLRRISDDRLSYDSGPVYLVHAHYSELGELVGLLAKRGDVSVRNTCLAYWSEASADGKRFEAERQVLANTEKRTPEQEAAFQRMSKQNNSINITLERACKVYRGVAFMKSIGLSVDIEKVAVGVSYVYETYVKRAKVERNDVFFNAAQLMRVEDYIEAIKPDATAVDIRTMLKSSKGPNDTKGKGNGERIAPSKIAGAAKDLETSLAAIAQDGGGFALGPDANDSVLLLYALLHSTLTEQQRTKAFDLFAKEAASGKEAAKPANIVQTVKKLVGTK